MRGLCKLRRKVRSFRVDVLRVLWHWRDTGNPAAGGAEALSTSLPSVRIMNMAFSRSVWCVLMVQEAYDWGVVRGTNSEGYRKD